LELIISSFIFIGEVGVGEGAVGEMEIFILKEFFLRLSNMVSFVEQVLPYWTNPVDLGDTYIY
jgi:hypothetical protein